MRRGLWSIGTILLACGGWNCGKDYALPPKFHEERIGMPDSLAARYADGDVVLQWNMRAPAGVYYYLVTASGGTLGEKQQYVVPGDEETYTVSFAWADSFYTFYVQAVDTTNFIGQRSNVDTVFLPVQ